MVHAAGQVWGKLGGLASVRKSLGVPDAVAHGCSASSPSCARCPVLTGSLLPSLGSRASVCSQPCVSPLVLHVGVLPLSPIGRLAACPPGPRGPDALSLPLEPGAPFHAFSVSASVFLLSFGAQTPSQNASEFQKHTEPQGRPTDENVRSKSDAEIVVLTAPEILS